jgi:hypothetical protein
MRRAPDRQLQRYPPPPPRVQTYERGIALGGVVPYQKAFIGYDSYRYDPICGVLNMELLQFYYSQVAWHDSIGQPQTVSHKVLDV